ncbi:MAG: hypothetical protein JO057_21330 [Chloroflexi bacterium]|nr:hypothetical protein [Chloroflexota bacterium]
MFLPRADDQARCRISSGEDSFDFTMREESDKFDTYSAERVAAAKYPWQRVSPTPDTVPSERLMLEFTDGYRTRRWADRTRLESGRQAATTNSSAPIARFAESMRQRYEEHYLLARLTFPHSFTFHFGVGARMGNRGSARLR